MLLTGLETGKPWLWYSTALNDQYYPEPRNVSSLSCWSLMPSTLEKGGVQLGASLVKRTLLTPHAQLLSSEEGVHLRKSKPLGRHISKEFWGCLAIWFRWLWVGEEICSQNLALGQDTCQCLSLTELCCWRLCTVSRVLPCLGTGTCFSNKSFPVCCESFPDT